MFEYGNDGPSLILVAIDGSETSMRAGAYAAGLARRQNSRLVCLYVHSSGGMVATVPSAMAASVDASEDIAKEIAETIRTQAPRLGIETSFIERHGDPYHEIVKVADELRADALVVGASMQAGHRIIGSLAAHLVRSARWPVTVVP